MIVCRYIQYVIYKCKLREKIPSMVFVYEEVHNFLERLKESTEFDGTCIGEELKFVLKYHLRGHLYML